MLDSGLLFCYKIQLTKGSSMDRFDLENQINSLLNISEDIELLYKNILENKISNEEIANILIGLNGLIKLRQDQLFETMKIIFKLDEYSKSNF